MSSPLVTPVERLIIYYCYLCGGFNNYIITFVERLIITSSSARFATCARSSLRSLCHCILQLWSSAPTQHIYMMTNL